MEKEETKTVTMEELLALRSSIVGLLKEVDKMIAAKQPSARRAEQKTAKVIRSG